MSNSEITVGFLGLSHLGIVSAMSLATKSVKTIGIDRDAQLVDSLIERRWPIQEPGIDEQYERAKAHLSFSHDLQAVAECDILYISRDVPTDDFGVSDLTGIEALIREACKCLPAESTLVILCQVPPGFSRRMREYHLNIYYQVETLVFGEAFLRANFPERLIIGVSSKMELLDPRYQEILERFLCPILVMDFESAELTKISINAFLAASVTTTNVLNNIANSVGANWKDIRKALQLDRRIGQFAYLSPGLGISGGNIERDLRTLDEIAGSKLLDEDLFRVFLANSKRQKMRIVEAVRREILALNPTAQIGILGLSYKINTHSTKNSMALELLRAFWPNISGVYDPLATLPPGEVPITMYSTAHECITNSDAVVVMTPWSEFSTLTFGDVSDTKKSKFVVIDPYGIVDRSSLETGIVLKGLS